MHFSLEKETNFIRNCMLQKLNVCSSQLYAPFWIFSKYAPAKLAILPKCMLQMEHTRTLCKIDANIGHFTKNRTDLTNRERVVRYHKTAYGERAWTISDSTMVGS